MQRSDRKSLRLPSLAFLIPVVVFIIATVSDKVSFDDAVANQFQSVELIRDAFSRGRLFIPDGICDILMRGLYPSFVLELIFGGAAAEFLIKIIMFIRVGLTGVSMFVLLARGVELQKPGSLLLSVTYALTPAAVTGLMNPQVMNLMIVLPLCVLHLYRTLDAPGKRSIMADSLFYMLLITAGLYGVIAGMLMLFATLLILWFMIIDCRAGRAASSLGLAFALQALLCLPCFFAGNKFINLKEVFTGSSVSFTFFDFVTLMFGGNSIAARGDGYLFSTGLTVLVLILVLLFFFNPRIEFLSRFTSGIFIILAEISLAWSIPRQLLTLFKDFEEISCAMKSASLVMFFTALAAVSFKHIKYIRREIIVAVMVGFLCILCLSDTSGASEVSRSAFYMYFNFIAVIFWCVCLMHPVENNLVKYAVLSLGTAGLITNFFYCVNISDLGDVSCEYFPYFGGSGKVTGYDEALPLSADDGTCLVLYSDMSGAVIEQSVPRVLNMMARASLGSDIYSDSGAFPVFTEGATYVEDGIYSIDGKDDSAELLIRLENMDEDGRYFMSSSFDGISEITVNYSVNEDRFNAEGPVVKLLPEGQSALTLRIVSSSEDEFEEFMIWKEDGEALNEFLSKMTVMDDYSIEVPESYVSGKITIVTSMPYSERIKAKVKDETGKVSCEVFELAGRVCVAFDGEEGASYGVKLYSSKTIMLPSILPAFLYCGFIVYNGSENKRKRADMHAEQKDC